MKTRRDIGIYLAAVAGLAAIAVLVIERLDAWPRQSQEKRIQRCIEQLGDQNYKVRGEAARALVEIGAAAARALGEVLVSNGEINGDVANVLADLGPGAADAVPALIRSLSVPRKQNAPPWEGHKGLTTIVHVGPAAIPALEECVRNGPSHAVAYAVAALGQIGGQAVPFLFELLHDENASQRANAAYALRGSKDDASEVVPRLMEALNDVDSQVRVNAVSSLASFQGDAQDDSAGIIPRLVQGTSDPDPKVRKTAITELGMLRRADPEIIGAFVKALEDKSPEVQRAVLRLYGATPSPPVQFLPALISLLDTANRDTLFSVSQLLLLMGSDARPAMPALVRALGRPGSVGAGVARVVYKIDPTAPELRPALLQALAADNYWDCFAACTLLPHIGPPLPEALPLLKDILIRCFSSAETINFPAKSIAESICVHGGDLATFLAEALKAGPWKPDRLLAMGDIAGMVASSNIRNDAAVSAIVQQLAANAPDKCDEFRREYGAALGVNGKEAIPIALSYLGSEHYQVACVGCEILRHIGPEAFRALAKLRELQKRGNPCAQEAIEAISGK